MTDGQALYEAYQRALGCEPHWNRLVIGTRMVWDETAAAMRVRFAQTDDRRAQTPPREGAPC